jgi:hypothetical protein
MELCPEHPPHCRFPEMTCLVCSGSIRLSCCADHAAVPLAKCLRAAVSAARDEIRVDEALIAHDPEKREPVFG